MMRIALFLLTNLAVMVVFGLVLSLTGIQSSSVQGLLIMALLFGFGGSFISLLMSKWMALKSVGGEVIEQPRNDMEQWLMNTVAQQSRQAGIVMPQVAIYHAPDINAFATGARRDASLVAVSTGLLQNMSRDEAEAVIQFLEGTGCAESGFTSERYFCDHQRKSETDCKQQVDENENSSTVFCS